MTEGGKESRIISNRSEEDYNSFYFRIDDLNQVERRRESEELTFLVNEQPENFNLLVKRGIVRRKLKRGSEVCKESIQDLEYVLSKSSPESEDYHQAMYNLGMTRIDVLEEYQVGLDISGKMISINTKDPWAYFLKARYFLYNKEEDLEKSLRFLNLSIEYCVDKTSIIYMYTLESLSYIYQFSKANTDFEKAEKFCKEILSFRSICRVHLRLGRIYYYDLNMPVEALEQFRKVLSINPKYNEANYMIANYYSYHTKDMGQALHYFNKEIDCDPTHYMSYSRRAYIHHVLGRFKEALDDYSKSIENSDGTYLYPYAQRGILYDMNFQNYELAEKDFLKTVQICEHPKTNVKKESRLTKRYALLLMFYRKWVISFEESGDLVKVFKCCEKYVKFYRKWKESELPSGLEENSKYANWIQLEEENLKKMVLRKHELLSSHEDLLKYFFLKKEEKEITRTDFRARMGFLSDVFGEVVFVRLFGGVDVNLPRCFIRLKILK